MSRKRNILTVLLLSAAPAAASPDAHAPPPDAKVSKATLDLRLELIQAGRGKARRDDDDRVHGGDRGQFWCQKVSGTAAYTA